MHVAVVIVGFRNASDVAVAVQRVLAQTHCDVEIIICENGGEDAERALEAALSSVIAAGCSVRILAAPDNPGYAGGVNRGMAAAPDADAWWVLNPDTEPQPTALAALVTRLAVGDVAAVGGVVTLGPAIVQAHGGKWRSRLARPESIGHGTPLHPLPRPTTIEPQLDYLLGASMLVGRVMFETVGPMREDYFLYCEEVEWCLRAKAAGLRFGYAPDAVVIHHQGSATGSGKGLRERPRLPIWLDERNKINVVRDTRPQDLLFAIPASLIIQTLRYGKALAWRQWLYAVSGWWAGVRNQRGKPPWMAGD